MSVRIYKIPEIYPPPKSWAVGLVVIKDLTIHPKVSHCAQIDRGDIPGNFNLQQNRHEVISVGFILPNENLQQANAQYSQATIAAISWLVEPAIQGTLLKSPELITENGSAGRNGLGLRDVCFSGHGIYARP